MSGLKGRTALVTGAGAGIGRAIALRFAREGARVAVADIDSDAASQTADSISDGGGQAASLTVDVSDAGAVALAVKAAVELGQGRLEIVVNNAGIIRPAMLTKMDESTLRAVLDVHVVGAFLCSTAALPFIPEDGTGRIINVTSAAGIRGTIGQANYAAAKAAIIGLTKSMARELARRNITVNAIAPLAATAMTETVRTDERFAGSTLAEIPLGRWAEPEEIAGAFAFLASDDASYITGQVLAVDGGLVM